METVLFFLFSLLVYVADGEKEKKEVDPFVYDYHSLRICGLVFGVVLFALGILLILSRKCRCCPNQEKKLKAPGDEEATAETLIVSKGVSVISCVPVPFCDSRSPVCRLSQ
ncbi:FXYD domain-containing ion transport regulator 6-like isoform X2 [Salvelinus alpinus]|uniref:FXYD domain-containing ion transport regulator 6-like isoform X2 n=1 Tax=Salvelinus alpinus TaxID=8036 RepID=UPI0039FD46A1